MVNATRPLSTSKPAKAGVGSTPLPDDNLKPQSYKPLYASQSTLPHLPVPTLESTFSKYLETLTPHLNPDQLSNSRSQITKFLSSPLSKMLQSRLEARATKEGRDSWLSEWWNDVAYMGYRDSIVPNVNYYYVHKEGLGKGKGQVERTVELIRAVKEFRDLVISERLEPEKVKGQALCCNSYHQLFNSSRIPTKPSDQPKTYPADSNQHVIVVRKNRFFKVDVEGRGAGELRKAVEEVVRVTDGQGEGVNLGALTSENRDTWTEAREHLLSLSPNNKSSLESIESSICLFVLDSAAAPSGRDARSWDLYVGDGGVPGKNRWFDKHEFVVDVKGESGFNGEHSMLDGTPTLRMNEFVLAALDKGKIPLELSESERKSSPLTVEEVKFETDGKIVEYVKKAEERFKEDVGRHDLKVLQFEGYGKDLIKKHKCSPDAWVQMTKQLAYGKMTGGEPGVTYESAQTRKFKLGRTEVIRSASKESKAFVDAMLDSSKSDAERAKLLRAAIGRHIQYSVWAADGQGVDRHMFGLRKLLKEGEDMPEVFKDEAFAKSSTWTLSTSNLTSEYLDNWGYGQVVPEGFGLSYSISDHYLRWGIMTTTGKADEMKESLIWAANEIRRMMDSAAKSEAGKVKL